MRGNIYIRKYKELTPRMLCYLFYNFTLDGPNSGMKLAIQESRVLYSFVAFRNRKVIGWAIVYKGYYGVGSDKYNSVGVFISPENRHQGIGGELKSLAIKWGIKQEPTTIWYDAKNGWMSCIAPKLSENIGQLK